MTSYTKANIARTTTADADLVSSFPRVAAVKPIVDAALAFADTIGKEPVGKQTADITRALNAGVEDRAASRRSATWSATRCSPRSRTRPPAPTSA